MATSQRKAIVFALLYLSLHVSPSSSSRIFLPSSSLSDTSASKVSVGLYYESLCPYCSKFIVNHLIKLFQNDLISIVDLHLSPWGNTKLLPNDTVVCQHGPFECLLDTVEACAIDAWPELHNHFPFIYCIESLVVEHKYAQWETCFEKIGLDPKPVADCYSSEHGKELELKYAAETNALQPPHEYVPWVVVDGQPLYEDYEDFISFICKAYKGNPAPKACSELSRNAIHKVKVKRVDPTVCHKETVVSALFERVRSAVMSVISKLDMADSM